jgi:hypothetical protein
MRDFQKLAVSSSELKKIEESETTPLREYAMFIDALAGGVRTRTVWEDEKHQRLVVHKAVVDEWRDTHPITELFRNEANYRIKRGMNWTLQVIGRREDPVDELALAIAYLRDQGFSLSRVFFRYEDLQKSARSSEGQASNLVLEEARYFGVGGDLGVVIENLAATTSYGSNTTFVDRKVAYNSDTLVGFHKAHYRDLGTIDYLIGNVYHPTIGTEDFVYLGRIVVPAPSRGRWTQFLSKKRKFVLGMMRAVEEPELTRVK